LLTSEGHEVKLPVEMYSERRIREFDKQEAKLDEVLPRPKKKRPKRRSQG